jgi:putative ABC transport system substrate-binding protein
VKRRKLITLLGGAAAALPFTARAQQGERVRRVGILMQTTADEAESQARVAAFLQGLQEAGWSVGRNLRIDYRWAAGDRAQLRRHAAELVALGPDVVLAGVGGTAQEVQLASRTVPIVFAQAIDPVGVGIVESLARPGTNATGFAQFEYSLSGKWLELLREVAPGMMRTAVVRDPRAYAGIGQWAVIQAAASPLGVEVRPVDLRDSGEIARRMTAFARDTNGGVIVTVSTLATIHRDLIVKLAARHRLPAVYPYRFYVAAGGLLSYGPDLISPYRRAAGYVDRILKGEKPADLPVQAPTRYELVVNLKTAKALGLEVPPTLLARADEVIE